MFGHGPMPLCMHSKELGNIGMGKFNYAMIDMWFLYSNYIGFLNFFSSFYFAREFQNVL